MVMKTFTEAGWESLSLREMIGQTMLMLPDIDHVEGNHIPHQGNLKSHPPSIGTFEFGYYPIC
jgi:hypothetical protein